jgi:site-specific recombinase XerC
MTALAPTLQAFFTDRLALQRQANGHTVAAYRDALRMLVVYAAQQAGKTPVPAGHRRPGRADRRRVPQPPGKRPRQQRPDP